MRLRWRPPRCPHAASNPYHWLGPDGRLNLLSQLKLFQQTTKPQDADAVGDALHAGAAHKLPVQLGLEQGLFHGQVGQAKPLLHEVGTQHGFQLKRRTSGLGSRCVRHNQQQQFRPRHHQMHLVEKHRLAREPLVQVEPQVLLLHGHIVRRRVSQAALAAGF